MGVGAQHVPLFPLREKAAHECETDEGSRGPLRIVCLQETREAGATPHPALRATFSRKREKDFGADAFGIL